jgi:hypothetical protein
MANDPGLISDTSTYLEAIAGDGGVHDPNGVWWLSPDIQLNGPVSGPDKADPGMTNTVDVTVHAGANGVVPPGTESITVDLFVGNPSLVMSPTDPQSTAHIDSVGLSLLPPGTSSSHQFQWTPISGGTPNDPQASGHRCLIVRAYSDPLTPDPNSFFTPEDRHVAQHNICIVPCGGPGAARRPAAGCGTSVTTINALGKPQKVRIRATLDTDPAKTVREIVLARLRHVKGFQRLASRGPKGFAFTFEGVKTRTVTPPAGQRGRVVVSEVQLEGRQFIVFRFAADLSGGKLGEAHIFHLTQADAGGRVEGGLTVVVLPV